MFYKVFSLAAMSIHDHHKAPRPRFKDFMTTPYRVVLVRPWLQLEDVSREKTV